MVQIVKIMKMFYKFLKFEIPYATFLSYSVKLVNNSRNKLQSLGHLIPVGLCCILPEFHSSDWELRKIATRMSWYPWHPLHGTCPSLLPSICLRCIICCVQNTLNLVLYTARWRLMKLHIQYMWITWGIRRFTTHPWGDKRSMWNDKAHQCYVFTRIWKWKTGTRAFKICLPISVMLRKYCIIHDVHIKVTVL